MKYVAIIDYINHDQIAATRPAHREYLTDLKNQGKLVTAGPFEDDSGALIVYEADSTQEVESLIQEDPFNKAGVFARYALRPWKKVF